MPITHTTVDTTFSHSPDANQQRKQELLALLRQTAPELVSDNQIDIQKLKDLLGEENLAGAEHYELSWAGKTAARREIQKTSSHTLLPFADNPEKAEHMLIEGENLEVLRLLQKSYYGKVKMIYIDPPYNTGNDSFVYPDDYSETLDEYLKRTGEKNAAGYLNKQSLWKKNSKESGRYHSAWLSMMYPRLYLAKNLLRNDGVIFISIDDNEIVNLQILMNEVFGEENYFQSIVWRRHAGGGNDSKYFALDHEYILAFARNKASIDKLRMPLSEEDRAQYKEKDQFFETLGPFKTKSFRRMRPDDPRPTLEYDIQAPDGSILRDTWKWEESKFLDAAKVGKVFLRLDRNDNWQVEYKIYLNGITDTLEESEEKTKVPRSLLTEIERNSEGKKQLRAVFEKDNVFSNPKPVGLIKYLMSFGMSINDLILDFFAGSGTTAQAVMELNLEDGGNRQCICVQMPEILEETSEAYKAGYRTIADITRARIAKVIAKLKAEHPDKTKDLAFANFKLAPSNFKTWRSEVLDASALREQLALFQTAEKAHVNVVASGDQIAMLSELLLKNGLGALGVHAITKTKIIAGITVHRVLMADDKVLWLCFEPYTEALKNEIVSAKPEQVILLNSCFVGEKADEQISNLQLELAGLEIALLVI